MTGGDVIKHKAYSRLDYQNQTLSMIDTLFVTKMDEKPYPLGPHIPKLGIPPSPPPPHPGPRDYITINFAH